MKRERKDQSEILRFAQNDRVFMVSACPPADGHERLPCIRTDSRAHWPSPPSVVRECAPEEDRSEVAELSQRPITRRAPADEGAGAQHPLPMGEGSLSTPGTPADLQKTWDMLSPGMR